MADRFKMLKHPYGALITEKVVNTIDNWFEFFRSPDFQYNAGKRTGVTMRVGDIDNDKYTEFQDDGAIITGDIGEGDTFNIAANGSISFNGTARIAWSKIAADSITLTRFTSPDPVSNLHTANDGNVYTLTEVAGGTNLIIISFIGVQAFNWVRFLGWYDGGSTHALSVQLEKAPFDGSAWDDLQYMSHSPGANHTNEDHSFFIPDDAAYINNGEVHFCIAHNTPVSNGHNLILDEVSLYQ